MTDTPAVLAEGVVKTFGAHRALDGVDLEVPAGSVFAVLGPNGAGKTTMVRILATLLRPDAGHARVFGHDVVTDAKAVRRRIGLTGQYASVDDSLTASENLSIFGRLLGLSRKEARVRADELLSSFGLTDAAARPVSGFSGGMRRRLDIASSLITRPPLLFLDEPTTGLDPRTRNQMWSTIRELVTGGSTVLLTTQYLEEADQLADRIAVIDQGRVVARGTSESLKDSLGLSTLRLQIRDRTRVSEASELLDAVCGAGVTLDPDSSLLSVAVTDPSIVSDVVLGLRDRSIDISEIGVVRPSLDDVFFALTDRQKPDEKVAEVKVEV